MAAKVVTITSGKGGVGKTTVSANLGAALASLGQKVVCIDADIGLRNLDVVLGLENRIVYDIVDVIHYLLKFLFCPDFIFCCDIINKKIHLIASWKWRQVFFYKCSFFIQSQKIAIHLSRF